MNCVIIPAYNEAERIGSVIEKAKKIISHVIVVDDGSSDETSKVAESSGATTLHHIVNLGKGAALKTGCDYAVKKGYQTLIVMDADGQHDPNDIPTFEAKVKEYDMVFGIRRLNKNMPTIARFGNWFISTLTNVLYGVKLEDTQSGFRAFTKETYKKIRWSSPDYSMESEMIANAGKHKISYTTVPIKTVYLDRYKGTTIITGLKIVLNMIAWKFTKNRK